MFEFNTRKNVKKNINLKLANRYILYNIVSYKQQKNKNGLNTYLLINIIKYYIVSRYL